MTQRPRLSIFAGPNGSGKSTLFPKVKEQLGEDLLGSYINADEIEKIFQDTLQLNLKEYCNVEVSTEEWQIFQNTPLFQSIAKKYPEAGNLTLTDNKFTVLDASQINSYQAMCVADFLRNIFLERGKSFCFETVMSHNSKIKFIEQARIHNYKIYLYYICFQSVELNIERVRTRAKEGGHDVSEDKIRIRYEGSLKNLSQAITNTRRTFFFENNRSDEPVSYIGEIQNLSDTEISFKPNDIDADNIVDIPLWLVRFGLEPLGLL